MPSSQGFRDLRVYQLAFKLAMEIYEESKKFPREEPYSLTDQIPAPHEACPVISVKATVEDSIQKSLSTKCLRQMAKEQKLRSGSILRTPAVTFQQSCNRDGGVVTKKSVECLVV
jgi:hypothetical protein